MVAVRWNWRVGMEFLLHRWLFRMTCAPVGDLNNDTGLRAMNMKRSRGDLEALYPLMSKVETTG